jgi:hypothetical protein
VVFEGKPMAALCFGEAPHPRTLRTRRFARRRPISSAR